MRADRGTQICSSFRFRAAAPDGALRLGFTHLGCELRTSVSRSSRTGKDKQGACKKGGRQGNLQREWPRAWTPVCPAGRNEGVNMKKGWLVVMLAALSASAWADGEAEYKYREGIMKSAGGHMSSMVAILRGACTSII